MKMILQIAAIFLLVIAGFIGVMSAYDVYALNKMKTDGSACGFETNFYMQSCECDGEMVRTDQTLNPSLAENIGGINYYCYGECHSCVCTDLRKDKKIDCSRIASD